MSPPPNPVFSPEYDHLREVLIAARQEAGLTQAAAAARLGRSTAYVALFENGQRRLDVLDFHNLAVALGHEPATLAQRVFEGFRGIQAAAGPGGGR
jgi:transcriptional regulator with XRE-family HTH domain